MDLLQLGAQLLQSKLGTDANVDTIKSSLTSLIGGGEQGLDLGSLVGKMMGSGGLQSMVGSWLGDGSNESISANQIFDIFGQDKVANFASQLGVDTSEAASGLSDVLPQLVDKASSGGSLLEQAGGVGGLFNMAKKFF